MPDTLGERMANLTINTETQGTPENIDTPETIETSETAENESIPGTQNLKLI